MAGIRAGQMDLFAASGETSKEDAPAPSAATIVALGGEERAEVGVFNEQAVAHIGWDGECP